VSVCTCNPELGAFVVQNLNAWGGDIHDGCEVHTFAWKGKHDRHNMMWGFFPLDDPVEAVNPCL